MKAYIQPFEKNLALAELEFVAGQVPVPVHNGAEDPISYKVLSRVTAGRLVRELAYWESVGHPRQLTKQALREASVNLIRNGVPVREIKTLVAQSLRSAVPNRRCLRYGTHGIHEYRGKFFPQLVRSLLNLAKLRPKSLIADPMCGSGTTAVESVLAEHNTIGLDWNPLSVLLAKTKCEAITYEPAKLLEAYERVRDRLLNPRVRGDAELTHFSSLSKDDRDYLRSWFSDQVLRDLDQVHQTVATEKSQIIRNLMLLAMSNIIRSVSWQKGADLRVRKEVRLDAEIDPVREFLEELGRSVRVILAFLYAESGTRFGKFCIEQGDAKELNTKWSAYSGNVDAIITSPPYATALPYLDTDRLSLSYLGLLNRSMHRRYDQHMIGNREITDRVRREYWRQFKGHSGTLPRSVTKLINRVEALNTGTDAGFRRRNLPALLAKYFQDMRQVLEGSFAALKSGASAFVVVGSNHTIAGGQRVDIETPSLLADVAKACGLKLKEVIEMEMLVSRDIFKKNAGESEHILWLTKP